MLPRRKNIRLPYYDYHTNGMYFITICTKETACIRKNQRRQNSPQSAWTICQKASAND